MPANTGQSGLMGKLGAQLNSAVTEHANDELTLSGFADLPPNVNGVAKLTECKFKQVADGKVIPQSLDEGAIALGGHLVERNDVAEGMQ